MLALDKRVLPTIRLRYWLVQAALAIVFVIASFALISSLMTGSSDAAVPTGNMTFEQISAGDSHTCAVASDGKAYCWGLNASGQLGNGTTDRSTVPTPVDMTGVLAGKTILQISTGQAFTCVLASDHKVYCWGNNDTGRLGNNSTTMSAVPVAVNTAGVLSGKTIRSVSAGYAYACVVASDNQAYCWGYNSTGQLGNNSVTQSLVPVAVNTSGVLSGKTIKSIIAGPSHTCAIASDNNAYCWGMGGSGQLGNNNTVQSLIPVAVYTAGAFSGKSVLSMSIGRNHTCAIASDNLAYCWGYNIYGQLGNNGTSSSSVPAAVNTAGVLLGKTVKSISVGGNHSCAIASDNLTYCWGLGDYGRLGNNLSTTQSLVPITTHFGGRAVTSIDAGDLYNCAIDYANQAYCWGYNASGQLGIGDQVNALVPAAVRPIPFPPVPVTQSTYRAYASSTVAAPGSPLAPTNTTGALSSIADPFRVRLGLTSNSTPRVMNMKMVTNGDGFSCGVAADNLPYCWGIGGAGRLGNGDTANSIAPVAVSTSGVLSGKTIVSISSGGTHTCVIASDFKAYCWGNNANGQLGNNSTTLSTVPVAVDTTNIPGDKKFISITAGYNHTCAIASDNYAYCWGHNNYGQLGIGSTNVSNIPVPVNRSASSAMSSLTVKAIAAGQYHTCAIAANNNAYCWGYNGYGNLGNNSTSVSYYPVAVSIAGVLSGKTINSISSFYLHTCVVASDNQAYC